MWVDNNKIRPLLDETAETSSLARSLPHSPDYGESETRKRWFEKVFFKILPVEELLPLASMSRGGNIKCRFGERAVGAFSVALSIRFDDGVEWIVKIPLFYDEDNGEHESLVSEYATLLFLQEIDEIPSPKVYGYAFDNKNPAKTPYIFMDKVAGRSFTQAMKTGLGKEEIYETLRQLAKIKKALACRPFGEIGSLTLVHRNPLTLDVDRQFTLWNFRQNEKLYKCQQGPYLTSMEYYSSLLHINWSDFQYEYSCLLEPDEYNFTERWNIHLFLASILRSYVKEDNDQFYLTHPDLSTANIFVDDKGNITGLIDWEFSSTLPFQSREHYPMFLMKEYEERFLVLTEGIYDDPIAVLREWREFYAKQFEGDTRMEDYLNNIDATIAFESILLDNKNATLENLVENFKFLQSTTALDSIGLPFPWTHPHPGTSTPTAHPLTETPLLPSSEIPAPTPHTEKPMIREIGTQTDEVKMVLDQFSMESRSMNSFVVHGNGKRGLKMRKCMRRVIMKVKSGAQSMWRVCSCRTRPGRLSN